MSLIQKNFDDSPTPADFASIMIMLARKYERMFSVPRVDANGECVWCPIKNPDISINNAVILDSKYDEKCTDDVHILQ